MKKLAIFLALMLTLASCGAKPDKSVTTSGEAADLADAVYFLAGEADADGCRSIFRLDKETLEITDEGTSARSLWAWDGKLYYNRYDSITVLGEGAVMGEYPDMQRFVLTDDVLYYPADDAATVMWELRKPDRIAAECEFPVFAPDGDWLPVTIEVLDTNGWYTNREFYVYYVCDVPLMFYEAETALLYNDGTFHLYDGWAYVNSGDAYAVSLEDGTRRALTGDRILAAANGRLFMRDGDDLRVCLTDAPVNASESVIEDAFASDTLIYVDAYSPVVYAIDTVSLTAEVIFSE